jgi:ankyrin repeat protein
MAVGFKGRVDLINAAIDRDIPTVERLLSEGAIPDLTDRQGWTALHFAAQNNDAETAKILLKHGAPLESRDLFGNTPLWRAVFSYRGAADCISVLLDAGANPDLANDHGVSPRSLAASISNYDTRTFFE